MLSKYTYAIWDATIALLTVLFAIDDFTRGENWFGVTYLIFSVVFIVFAIMAFYGKGIYRKHPITFKPNGEIIAKDVADKDLRRQS